jgi:hypothetical protein
MRLRLLTIPLIAAGLLILGLAGIAHFGPISIPGGGSDFHFLSVELDGSALLFLILGALMLIAGVAIEVQASKKK